MNKYIYQDILENQLIIKINSIFICSIIKEKKLLDDGKIRIRNLIGSHFLYEVSNISLVYMFGSLHTTSYNVLRS